MGDLRVADQDRFVEDVEPFRQHLMLNALRLTRNRWSAEDLVQDTLMRGWAGYDRFETGTNLRAWLDRIMLNCYINDYRKKQRSVDEVELGDLSDYHEDRYGYQPSAEDEMIDSIFNVDVKAALHALPEILSQPVLMAGVDRMTYREIAEELDVPIGTVMSRVFRGRKMLQLELWRRYLEGLNG